MPSSLPPDPATLDPALPDPALPDPALPDPALPDPAVPDPALPDPALRDPAGSVPAELSAQELADLRVAVARLTGHTAVGGDGAAPLEVRLVGAGLDHVVLAVEGTDLLARYRKRPDAGAYAAAEREAQLLRLLTGRPDVAALDVHLPEVLAELPEREGRSGRVVRRVPGRSLLEVPAPERAAALRLAEDIGTFLAALHAVPPDVVDGLAERDDFGLADWHDETAETVESLHARVPDQVYRALVDFVEAPVPDEAGAEVLVHNDLGAEHVHVTGSEPRLAGVIDWSDAALGDPAADIAPLLRDCGPAFLTAALGAYRRHAPVDPGLEDRALFLARCRWVEDQAFALDTGDPVFAEKARDSWSWLFDRGDGPPVTL